MRAEPFLALGLVVLAGTGVGLVAGGYAAAPVPPPRPASATDGTGPVRAAPPLPASYPTRIDIPVINVHAMVSPTGTNPDGTLQVPPLDRPMVTGWYRNGPTPGEDGSAVILGHVDSYRAGAAVFFSLGALRPGATVEVTRLDHTVAVFRVDRTVAVAKDAFPATDVYGPVPYPALRLITCGGAFDPKTRQYEANTVVYATLAGWRQEP